MKYIITFIGSEILFDILLSLRDMTDRIRNFKMNLNTLLFSVGRCFHVDILRKMDDVIILSQPNIMKVNESVPAGFWNLNYHT